MIAGPGRSVLRVALPAELVIAIEAEARRRHMDLQQLIDELLVTQLPRLLAEAAATRLRHSIALSSPEPHDQDLSGTPQDGSPS